MSEILPPPARLILVVSSRYDVMIMRAMTGNLFDQWWYGGWYWAVELGGHRVADGLARTERQAERRADAAARRHARPPAMARHVPPRTYSINL